MKTKEKVDGDATQGKISWRENKTKEYNLCLGITVHKSI